MYQAGAAQARGGCPRPPRAFVRHHEALKGAPSGKPGAGACVELAPLPFTATGAGTCTTGAGVTCASSARRFTLLLPRPEYSDGVALLPTHVLNRATRLVIRLHEQREGTLATVRRIDLRRRLLAIADRGDQPIRRSARSCACFSSDAWSSVLPSSTLHFYRNIATARASRTRCSYSRAVPSGP